MRQPHHIFHHTPAAQLLFALLVALLPTWAAQANGPAIHISDQGGGSLPIALNGVLYFGAYDGGAGLWRSDGTPEGTKLIEPVSVSRLTIFGDRLFFIGDDGTHGRELWASDGTTAGTDLVKDIRPGPESAFDRYMSRFMYFSELRAANGQLFFTADDGASGMELWSSDGMPNVARLVKDINPGPGGSDPGDLTSVGARLFFRAFSPQAQLWVSDGSDSGTSVVKYLSPHMSSADPRELTDVNGTLFFVGGEDIHGKELWRSDGTPEGTALVSDINTNIDDYGPTDLTNVNGTLFFSGDDGSRGRELWRSDGTQAGTWLVKDSAPGPASSWPHYLTEVNGALFFSADDGRGLQLWRSDGTAEGTFSLTNEDFSTPHFGNIGPEQLANVLGRLLFAADDGQHGMEVWLTNGSREGTKLLQDIVPGPADSFPQGFTVAGDYLFFTVSEDQSAQGLWAVPLSALGFTATYLPVVVR
jgi:ELWxxDGT repeat protein